jgi:Ca-activated chloride channel family protein
VSSAVVLASAVGWGQTKRPNTDAKAEEPRDFTIQTTSRLVLLDVSVKDAAGGFVSGLTKDDFKVFENGKPQEISQFANADIPVTVGIAVDESGSMRPKRAQVVTAALVFNQASNPMDEMFIVNFNEKPAAACRTMCCFPITSATAGGAVARRSGGRTALYDAIEMSLISSSSDGAIKRRWS